MMKKLFLFLFVSAFLALSLNATQERQKYVIATATAGGTFYPVGVGIATIASLKLGKSHNTIFSAITSAGSCENIDLMYKGEINFAILQGLCGSMAWQGKGKHKGKPKKNLRSISMLWQNVEQFIISSKYAKTGNIKDLKNLYGKKMSIGGRSSGSRVSGEIILDALGIDYNKIGLDYLGYASSTDFLQKGLIEGMNTPAGTPTVAVSNAFENLGSDKIKILEFSEGDLANINSHYPVWSSYIIKAGTYQGQKKDIHTIAQPNLLVVTKETPTEIVYLLTKTIYENLEYLHKVHKATKSISLEKAIIGLPMPLHPGAVQFYKEKGIKIPQHLLQN